MLPSRISPSMMCADFAGLPETLAALADTGTELLHIDVMDGVFVNNLCLGTDYCRRMRAMSDIPLDLHLMITEPIRFVEAFKKAGADYLTVHYEACEDLKATLDKIHECGMKAGLSINPATPVDVLWPYLNDVDMFLIMSVVPGKGGQSFIPESLDKIRILRDKLTENGLDTHIQVDGGIYHANVGEVLEAGADIIVSGSGVFKGDTAENVTKFMEIFKDYE